MNEATHDFKEKTHRGEGSRIEWDGGKPPVRNGGGRWGEG